MKKGEIWMVTLPRSDGHEQHGERPVVVVADTKTAVAIIVPFTSNRAALRLPYTLRVTYTKRNGLRAPSILLGLQLRAIDKKRLHRKIGTLENAAITELDHLLKTLLWL